MYITKIFKDIVKQRVSGVDYEGYPLVRFNSKFCCAQEKFGKPKKIP